MQTSDAVKSVTTVIAICVSVISSAVAITWQLSSMNSQIQNLALSTSEFKDSMRKLEQRVVNVETWKSIQEARASKGL